MTVSDWPTWLYQIFFSNFEMIVMSFLFVKTPIEMCRPSPNLFRRAGRNDATRFAKFHSENKMTKMPFKFNLII